MVSKCVSGSLEDVGSLVIGKLRDGSDEVVALIKLCSILERVLLVNQASSDESESDFLALDRVKYGCSASSPLAQVNLFVLKISLKRKRKNKKRKKKKTSQYTVWRILLHINILLHIIYRVF